mgnify:CR=1 FL=1
MEITYEYWVLRKDDFDIPAGVVEALKESMKWAGTAHADRMGAPRIARPGLVAHMVGKFSKMPKVDQATIDSPAKLAKLPKNRHFVIPADSLGRATGSPEESIRLWLKKWLPFIPSTAYAIVKVPVLH